MQQKSVVTTVILSVILYALSTGVSYSFFTFVASSQSGKPSEKSATISQAASKKSKFNIDSSLPKTEECPLNGLFYTKKEKDIWSTRRPLAIMVENSPDARPQSGISLADIVYEAVSEGAVTRFMGVFYCGATLGNIEVAPVRSARTYFIDWVSEYDALYNHVGGSNRKGDNADKTDPRADALGQIYRYGIKDMDQFGIGYPDCYRNPDRLGKEVATEHTMVCKSDNLYKIAQERGWNYKDEDGIAWDKGFVKWKFKDDAKVDDRPDTFSVEFGFWENYHDYDAKWVYDKTTNSFKRFTAGVEQKDLETEEPISVKNVIIQFSKEQASVDANLHTLYQTIGTGEAIVFQDGVAIKGTWQKKDRLSRTTFIDKSGKEIKFNRGQIWIEIVPIGNKITY